MGGDGDSARGVITDGGGRIISALPASEGRWEIDIEVFVGYLDEDFQINGTTIAREELETDLERGDETKEVDIFLNFDVDDDGDLVSNVDEMLEGTDPSDRGDCPKKVWYKDADSDRYTEGTTQVACASSSPYNLTSITILDCDDTDPSIYPGASLNCNNGKDNDCSGQVEVWFYQDQDSDTWTTSVSQCANSMPSGFTSVSKPTDCDDSKSSINPSAPDNTCDLVDNNCNLYIDESTAPCFAPSSLTISTYGLTQVSLSWTYPEPSSNVENFVVEKSPNGITFAFLKSLPGGVTSYTDTAYLVNKYYYRVYAKNATGSGSPSSITSAPIGVASLFQKTFGGSDDDGANSVIQSTDGGYVVVGSTDSFGAGGDDFYIVKIDSSGNIVWTKTFGGTYNDRANSVIQSTDGGYVVAGSTGSFGAGGWDIYIVKIDVSGNVIWTKTVGGSGVDYANSLIQSTDGGYVVVGYTQSFGAGSSDFYIVKAGPSFDTCFSQAITNYTVGFGGSVSSPTSSTSSVSPTVNAISPTTGSGGSVIDVCVSPGAPVLPMCYAQGSCEKSISTIPFYYHQSSSDGSGYYRTTSKDSSYGCSVGLGEICIPLLFILYILFKVLPVKGRFKKKMFI